MHSCAGQLRPASLGRRCRSASPRDSGPGPRFCMVNEHPRGIRAWVRGPAVSTSYTGRFTPSSDSPQRQQALPGDSGPGLMARGVNQLSRATCALVRGPVGSTSSPGRPAPLSDSPHVNQQSWVTFAWSEGQRCRPAFPGDLRSGLRARRVDRLFWMTRAWLLETAGSTSSPGGLRPVSKGPRCRPAI